MEADMSRLDNESVGLTHRFAQRWRAWRARRRSQAELRSCGSEDVERMAHDLGVGGRELCVLAGKWPDSADPLIRRMHEIELDASKIAEVEPAVIRDLQRVCSLCASKWRCARDLNSRPADAVWRQYCPNSTTLTALIAKRAKRQGSTDSGAYRT
jgi:hypothetical protein